jgi:hypothetical protein
VPGVTPIAKDVVAARGSGVLQRLENFSERVLAREVS